MNTLFIYIHGFNSSPASYKAQCFEEYLQSHQKSFDFIAPKLSDLPNLAIQQLTELIESTRKSKNIVLIGSSLGGFYATYLSEQYKLKAALINPAVNPAELLVDYLGYNQNFYTGERYEFTAEHIKQLQALTINQLTTPKNLLVLLQTGDEVLDYHLAAQKYENALLTIEQGGNHSFEGFAQRCQAIYDFLTA